MKAVSILLATCLLAAPAFAKANIANGFIVAAWQFLKTRKLAGQPNYVQYKFQ